MIHYKSPQEIEALRASAQLVGRTLAEVAKHIRPGVRTAELDSIAETFIRDNGAIPTFKGYRVGRNVYPASLCISVNDVVVHGIPGDLELQEGDLVSVDCGVLLDGYCGDSAFTFACGPLSPEKARLCKVTYESLLLGIKKAIAGNRIGDISHAVQAHCEEAGYGVVTDLVGHGIGTTMHEEPQVPNYGRPGSGKKLKAGLTICIEPMVNMGTPEVTFDEQDGWTVRTEDGAPSAHYEHTVAVQPGRADVLTTFKYIEEVVTPPYLEEVIHG